MGYYYTRVFSSVFPVCCCRVSLLLLWPAFGLLSGCMTPERAVREADRIGTEVAAVGLRQVTGRTNMFTVVRPSDRLRARLMLSQSLPGLADSGRVSRVASDPLTLTLAAALRVGARNDSKYQTLKESIFAAALALDLQRHAFENTFAGLVGGGVARTDAESEAIETRAEGRATAGVSRTLANGAKVAANLGLDVVRLLTGDRSSALGLTGDATITLPLLRGSGRAVVREALTQAERDLFYVIHDFEAYRQAYAVEVAGGYFGVLESIQQLRALRENEAHLSDSYRRAQMQADAGRMPRIQVDQTRQDLLRTGEQLVRAQQSLDAGYDQLKLTLGLPADARLAVAMDELERLQAAMAGSGGAGTNVNTVGGVPVAPWSETEAVGVALTNRHDLLVARWRLEDAARAVGLAADALRPDLTLTAGGTLDTRKASGESAATTRGYRADLEAGLPWERTAERNAYRGQLLAMDAAVRGVEAAEDGAKVAVRSALRALEAAWASYSIQREALRVAERRVHSTDLFLQAGRAEARDVLEAQDALLNARNALVSAIVRYRLAGLELRRDMAVLEVSEEGLWRETDARFQP